MPAGKGTYGSNRGRPPASSRTKRKKSIKDTLRKIKKKRRK